VGIYDWKFKKNSKGDFAVEYKTNYYIYMTEDKTQCRAFVDTVINLQVK
jgi:hypothetical protein